MIVLHYDFDKATSKLTTVRLHQPADVCIKKEGLKARALHSLHAERSLGAMSFCDFEKRVQVDVKSLKRKPDLISHLQRLGLDT